MYNIYVLISLSDFRLYIGISEDVDKRLNQHNSGYVLATKNRRPFKLLYYEYTENLPKMEMVGCGLLSVIIYSYGTRPDKNWRYKQPH